MFKFYTKLTNYWERSGVFRSLTYVIFTIEPATKLAPQIWPIKSQSRLAIAITLICFGWLGYQPKKIRRKVNLIVFGAIIFFLCGLGGRSRRNEDYY